MSQLPLPRIPPPRLGPPPPGPRLPPHFPSSHHAAHNPQSPPVPGHPSGHGGLSSHRQAHRDTLPPIGHPPQTQQPYSPAYDTRAQYSSSVPAPIPASASAPALAPPLPAPAPPSHAPPPPPPHQDQYNMPRYMSQQPMAPPIMHGAIPSHKRAYRQRRKDPSCDACRERKVKCDATDATSCSECSGRDVKCQFTKETNRRMSSIKHIQDLEKKLTDAEEQISQLQQQQVGGPDLKSISEEDLLEETPNKRRRLSRGQDFQIVARNIETYGRDLIRLPTSLIESGWDHSNGILPPELPPKEVCEELINAFKTMLYTAFPCFSFATMKHRHDEIHSDGWGRPPVYSQSWYALYFAVMAFGTLRHQKHDGQKLYRQATQLLDLWSMDQSLDSVRATLILSMFQVESNNITSGFKTLGHAVRTAMDMGLHRRVEQRTGQDEQARLSLWWCLFSTERLLALDLGRPSMIDDSDCPPFAQAVGYDNRPIERQTSMPGSDAQFDFINQVARCTTYLQRAFKQPVISKETMQEVNEHVDRCADAFPPHQQLAADSYLDMRASTPIIYVQNLRLMLHRHNLSPASPPSVRKEALQNCVQASKDTAKLVVRTTYPPPAQASGPVESAEEKLRVAASAFFCSHLWRALLILVCSGEYASALQVARTSAAIGRHRRINSACGRYVAFLLGHIRNKRPYDICPLYDDEEMLAYATGDLQSNLDQAWVWQSFFGNQVTQTARGSAPVPALAPAGPDKTTAADLDKWDGWPEVLRLLEQMADEQRWNADRQASETAPSASSYQTSISGPSHYHHSPTTPTMGDAHKPNPPPTSSSRSMSIADLI